MACHSLKHDGEELLGAVRGPDAPDVPWIRGIPLLHPWANRIDGPRYSVAGKDVELDLNSPLVHTEDNGLPIHGLASACPYWEVVGRDTDGLHARLDYGAHEDLLAGFPFPHTLEIEISLENTRTALTSMRSDLGRDGKRIARDVEKLVHTAQRDAAKLSRAIRSDIER